MFRKLSLCFLLTASLSCFGQVAVVGGHATTAGPAVGTVPMSAANAPLVAAPDIALPGSGPAVGAPVSSANDSRTAIGPSIANPNAIMPQAAASSATPAPVTPASETETTANAGNETATAPATAANSQPFEPGIQHFVSGAPQSVNPTLSLAEIAAALKAQRHGSARAFNNDSIADLNARGVQTGNLGPGESEIVATNAAPAPSPFGETGTLMAQNEIPALPQSDQPAPQSNATAAQQRHRTPDQGAAPAQQQESAASQGSDNQQKLPQSSTSLPLLLVVGLVGVAGGAMYLLRR